MPLGGVTGLAGLPASPALSVRITAGVLGSGPQRQHEQSCGAALASCCCIKDAPGQQRLARLRLLFRR